MRRAHRGLSIGAAWVSLMEAEAGHDLAFHRWYSDDHFYAGGMNLAGIFAGHRWVCTRTLQDLRLVDPTSIFADRRAGKFLHTNLFANGAVQDVARDLGVVIADLFAAGRMHPVEIPRRHVYSRIQPWATTVYRDADPSRPLDIHALDHPYAGVVVEILEATPDRAAALPWLVTSFLPRELERCHADQCLVLMDEDLPDVLASRTQRIPRSYGEGPTRRLTLLWFMTGPPDEDWDDRFARHPAAMEQAGRARSLFISAFVPVSMGSDRYIDQLR